MSEPLVFRGTLRRVRSETTARPQREMRERGATEGAGGRRAVPSRDLSNLDHEVYVIERLEPVVWT